MAKREVIYTGNPTHCDVCNSPITTKFVDGITQSGTWANMCPKCFRRWGVGMGPGRGQAYMKRGDQFVKVAG